MELDGVATPSPGKPRGRGPAAAAASTRPWLVVSKSGASSTVDLRRHEVMRRTGLQARDLRALEPGAGLPALILVRERAIVVRLEHVRAIITATRAMVPFPGDPLVGPFVEELIRRGGSAADASPCLQDVPQDECHKALPFEFMVLELCLETALRLFESETSVLEKEMYVAVDALAFKISAPNSERVSQIKGRIVEILGYAHKMSSELENLLDNDFEMSRMCLTYKLISQQMKEASSDEELDSDALERCEGMNDASKGKTRSSYLTCCPKPEVQNLEILLEAYFVQIQSTLHKLSALRDDINDTIDFINITLDDKQNRVLHLGVIVGTAIFMLNMAIVMTTIFQISIRIDLYNKGYTQFWEISIGLVASALALFLVALMWYKKVGILS